jgi:multimeric flavodoxin WrbA
VNPADYQKMLLIAYHSQSGNTERLAAAVEEGALRSGRVRVVRVRAGEVTEQLMLQCTAVVVCSPEYFGYMAGAVKDLFDRTYEAVRDDMKGKSCAVVISAGNDGTGALTSIQRIVKGYGLKQVQEPIVAKGAISDAVIEQCRTLGETLAEGLDLGIY